MTENKNKLFYFSLISFFIGIFFAGSFKNFNISLIIFLGFLLIELWFYFKIKFLNYFKLNLSILSIIFFIFGFVWFDNFYKNKIGEHDSFLNKRISENFIIDDEPEVKGYHTKIILKFKNSEDRLISWFPLLPKYQYGDELKISGWLLAIKNFETDLGRKFDYKNYLKKDNIFYELKKPEITFIKNHQGNYLKEKLFIFKNELINQMKKLMPEPESSLLAGILIGAKEDMGDTLLENFRKTGIIHIVVLSGFNLTILAQFIMIILSIFGRKISAFFGSISIVLFAIMTGASATIVRASLMALLVILARIMGRNSEALRLLFVAAFIMLLFNPLLLLYDASFQLSFLATLGLLLLSPKIEKLIKYGDFKLFNLKEILGATLSTQVFVFPLILYMMGEVSIISPLVNILVLILVPFSMLWGILSLIISYFSLALGYLFSYPNFLILHYDLSIVDFFANFKYSTFSWKNFDGKLLFLTYFLYFLIYLIWKKIIKK